MNEQGAPLGQINDMWIAAFGQGQINDVKLSYWSGQGSRTLGPELVTNGGFDADTDWAKGAGWSIAGGVAIGSPGSSSLLSQDPITIVQTLEYLVVFTVVSISSGSVALGLGPIAGTSRTSVGVYAEVLVAGSINVVDVSKSVGFDGSIDNVSVREIL